MTTSEQINDIAAALAKAQGEMKNAALNKVNPHFKSKYADLAGIRDAVVPVLSKHGIAVVQTLGFLDGYTGQTVTTRLIHTSGQWIESACGCGHSVKNMQEMGSAITYARRYSLSAICGIAADEDDDANAASQPKVITNPEGYGSWMAKLAIASNEGVDALRSAFKSGTPAMREFLQKHEVNRYDDLIAHAKEVNAA